MTLADSQTGHAGDVPAQNDETALAAKIIFTVLVALIAWGVAIFTWGIPGLYIPAVASVPVIYALLITIAKG